MQRAHDILVLPLDATNDSLGIDANGRFGGAHISILIPVNLKVIAEDARFRAAFNLDDTAFLDNEFDWRQQPAEVMHCKIDHELAVGAALDGCHIELAGRK